MESELPTSPLQAVSSPFSGFPRIQSAYDLMSIFFTIVFILWLVYTIIAIYHWVRYGRNSWVAVPAVATHIVVSGALILFATAGFK